MRNLFLGSVVAIGATVAAHAADMAVKAQPVPELPYNWSGLYVGANFGGAWTNGSLNISNNNFYGGLTEFIDGVQAGYNFQAGHLLFGVEGDFDGATFSHQIRELRRLSLVLNGVRGGKIAQRGVVRLA